jgi:hypothetical protein
MIAFKVFYVCSQMLRKAISVGLAIHIILCSIGVQVMQHHCVWCGGDRIEVVASASQQDEETSCCADKKEEVHNGCHEGGCCLPKLLKLTSGMTFENGFDMKPYEIQLLTFDWVLDNISQPIPYSCSIIKGSQYLRGSPPFYSPHSFLSPLRC